MKTGGIIRRFSAWGAVVFAFVLVSCVNQMLPEPIVRAVVPEEGGEPDVLRSPWGAPMELTASQGKKGTIVLSWKPVADAVRYLIYESESPLSSFVQSGETADDTPAFEVKYVPPGATLYFKAAALNKRNEISAQSGYVAGRSLAQPVIYSIEPDPNDVGSVTVYWSMNNMDPNTYEEKIRYLVHCYEGSALAAEIPVSGSFAGDPFVKFTGLSADTEYEFEVEAWLEDEAGEREFSGRIDAKTAQRLRPGAPVDLATNPGKETQTVTLSFKLPEEVAVSEMVDGVKTYVPHALYFVISRREAGTNGEFQVIDPYFGSDADKAGGTADFTYTEGETVSWTDTLSDLQRGVRYEYKVQAYVDGIDKKVTTNDSIATVTGWAMKKPQLSFGAVEYTAGGPGYVSALLPLAFTHDDLGVEYDYRLTGNIRRIEDGNPLDAAGGVSWGEGPFTLAALQAYRTSIDLTGQTSSAHRGRGWYSYTVAVSLKGTAEVIETADTVGEKRIFEKNLAYLNVEGFAVKDGYPDKFVLTWKKKAGLTYKLKSAPEASGPWADLPDDTAGAANDNYTYDLAGQSSGISCYFSIYAVDGADEGEAVYSGKAQTLGTPDAGIGGSPSYDTVTLTWPPVQKADKYRVWYKYEGGSYASTGFISAAGLSFQGGKYVYEFKPFSGGALDAAQAGKPMDIKLEALNDAANSSVESNVISNARLFGPAEINATATQNTSADSITLTWKAVTGAAGYYVVRQQGQINAGLPGGGETTYYVNAGNKSLTGKDIFVVGGIKSDSAEVSAELAYSDADGYTLTDKALDDNEYTFKKDAFGIYADQQNDIPWGYPYAYYVVPVLSENDRPSIRSDKSCVVGGITYSGTSMAPLAKTGRALGFVLDVTATKGTFSGPGEDDDETANIGVKVTWAKPEGIDGAIAYKVFRRAQTSSGDWDLLTSSPINSLSYEDKHGKTGGPVDGNVYEYVVGVVFDGKTSEPGKNGRFIAQSRIAMDNNFPAERKIAGYVLPRTTMLSASRIAQSDADGPYETVKFYAAGVDSHVSARKDRGIHGYAIQVRDQSSARKWTTIMEIPIADADPSTYTANIHNINGLLNVLRDYRHYYRIRTYADYGGKIYSPPPPDPGLTGVENEYIKWGARPITATEFAGLTSLAIGTALTGEPYNVAPISGEKTKDVPINKTPFFLTVSGTLRVTTNKAFLGSANITKYGNNNTLTFSFNATDVPGLVYKGSVTISSLTSTGGSYSVTFNGTPVSVDRKYILKPFTFSGTTGQNCDGFDNWNAADGWK